MKPRILVVEPDPRSGQLWRFGRVADPGVPLSRPGLLRVDPQGGYELLAEAPGHYGDSVTALVLIRRAGGERARLLYLFPDDDAAVELPQSVRTPPARSTRGRGKGGSGESLAERAARSVRPLIPPG